MAEQHPDLHPHLADLWAEYVRRERKWAEDPTNRFAYHEAMQAFEQYDRKRRELFDLLHPDEEEGKS
ncbi:hypothetical protein H0Z60_11505 [Ectothiorhodospiraceae bacterium WFHF3C12]|nr:hypothetical protein [Ectothiorhodospiraceae bacterium WFHF3C12]